MPIPSAVNELAARFQGCRCNWNVSRPVHVKLCKNLSSSFTENEGMCVFSYSLGY